MNITVPDLSLILLVGTSGSGKSTFARKHFLPTEVVSSDFCRGLVSDDENSQEATKDAFDLVHEIIRKRLARGLLTVVDATNVQPESRKALVDIAKQFHTLVVAIVFDIPERICQERNDQRPDRQFGPHVIRNQAQQLRRSFRGMERAGIRYVYKLDGLEAVENVTIERQPLWNNKKAEHGPFDIVGDVHGCYAELLELLHKLGYSFDEQGKMSSPEGRKLVFVGDYIDRGPKNVDVLRLVMKLNANGQAYCVPGNHDVKLLRALKGRNVKRTHGLDITMEQLEKEPLEFRQEVAKFLDSLISHYVFDDGKLVVAHAGLLEEMQGRGSGAVREFAVYGEATGEMDDVGLPVRYNWALDYRGKSLVVFGHVPVAEPLWLNNTLDLDTGCVFGGALSALRYPEREIVAVPAHQVYAEPMRPFLTDPEVLTRATQHEYDDVLLLSDVIGKRLVDTRLKPRITIREENAIAALEVMSRFAIDPKWLIYLPPTMSPTTTTERPGLLEHPDEAFSYFRKEEIKTVVCEQKHMGSRAVVIICRNEEASIKRFGVVEPRLGVVYTRTGRQFFNEGDLEREFLRRVRDAVEASGLWDELATDWICLDCELMPWSAKAQELIQRQYAPVGSAGLGALTAAKNLLDGVSNEALDSLKVEVETRLTAVEKYVEAYRDYCWPVESLKDFKLAPFHLLASEGCVHTDKTNVWHMETLARFCAADMELLLATPFKVVDLEDEASCEAAVEWWTALTSNHMEGMVVKPLDFIGIGRRGPTQPAIKCRGPEYLRIIYGPEYLMPANLQRLRSRGVAAKRSLAFREFTLGIEALERFVRREPLRLTHECVFGVLALESEPVDPRL